MPLEELRRHADSSPILRGMLARGGPLTRKRYLNLAYGDDIPDPWTTEHELEVPEPFRKLMCRQRAAPSACASNGDRGEVNGLISVTPPSSRPSSPSSLSNRRQPACLAVAHIIASQNDR